MADGLFGPPGGPDPFLAHMGTPAPDNLFGGARISQAAQKENGDVGGDFFQISNLSAFWSI